MGLCDLFRLERFARLKMASEPEHSPSGVVAFDGEFHRRRRVSRRTGARNQNSKTANGSGGASSASPRKEANRLNVYGRGARPSKIAKGDTIAFALQSIAQPTDVRKVTRLDDAMDRHGGDVLARERAIMLDVVYARAFLGDDAGEMRQPSGTVADDRSETTEPPIRREATLDDPA